MVMPPLYVVAIYCLYRIRGFAKEADIQLRNASLPVGLPISMTSEEYRHSVHDNERSFTRKS